MNVDGSSFVYEIRELAGVVFIESPLYADHDQNDEDGRVAVNFQHGLLVWWFAEDKQKDSVRHHLTKIRKFPVTRFGCLKRFT